eukprot:scaffold1340_cov253-Pinguiococcus_pyrenoidosus.AAC.20
MNQSPLLGGSGGRSAGDTSSGKARLRHRTGGRKRMRSGADAIKLVGVLDAKTGILLFQKVYRWAEDANPKALGSLVLSFFQFSREIDDGTISCVNFEKPVQVGGHRRQPR